MSFWYDKKGKSYASKGNSSWVKFYAEYLVSTLRGEVENLRNTLSGLISRHFSGVEGKHKAEDIIFDESRSVKNAISENKENIGKIAEDVSGKADINHIHEGYATKNDIKQHNGSISAHGELIEKVLDYKYATVGHNHDADYATLFLLEGKANIDHNHKSVYAAIGHKHDTDYVTPAELAQKADLIHNHEGYATEEYVAKEITKVNTGGTVDLTPYATKNDIKQHNGSISAHGELIEKVLDYKYATVGHNHDADYATLFLLEGKANIDHNHKSVYAAIGHKHDTDYVTPAELAQKADLIHNHEGYATADLSNVTDSVFKAKADAAGVGGGNTGGGIPVIEITGDGVDFTATDSRISALTHGMTIVVSPDMQNFTSPVTLNINGLGAKNIRRLANGNISTTSGYNFYAGIPFTLVYHAGYSDTGSNAQTGVWILADKPQINPAADFATKIQVSAGGTGTDLHTKGNYLVGNGQSAIQSKTPAEVLEDICKKPTLTATTPRGVKIGSENWTGTGYFCTDTDVLYQVKDSAVEDGAAYTRFCLRPSDRSLKNYLNWTPYYVNGDTEIEFVWSETRGLYDALILLTDESAQDVINNRIVWKFHPPVKIKYGRISNAIRKSTIAEGDIRYAMAPKECLRDFSGCFSEKDKEIIEKIYNESVIEPFEGLAPNELSFLYLATDCLGNGEVFTYPTLSEAVSVIAGVKSCLTIETIDNFED